MKKRAYMHRTLFLLIFLVQISSGRSSEVKFWIESERSDFEKGTLQGVSVLSPGGITLSPKIKPVNGQANQNSAPFFWCQVTDSSGNLYIGSGNDGTIFKVTRDGKMSAFFKADEPEVTALAVDKNDAIYAGTSPQGKIYKISRGGDPAIFSEPEERYIWALASDPSGNLYAATGEKGLILKILQSGEYKVFFDSEEPHIVSLAFDEKRNLLAGSEGKGIIYKIAQNGKGTVIFSSGKGEISSIVTNQDGTIFFSSIVRKEDEARPSPLQMTLKELISSAELEKKVTESAMEEAPGKKFAATLEGFPLPEKAKMAEIPRSSIYAIPASGEAQRYLDFSDESVFALCPARDGKIYVGTGEPGKFYRLEEKGRATLLRVFDQAQVTSIITFRDSELSLITSNMGSAHLLSPELENTGVFLSRPFDTAMRSEWGKITCSLEQKEGSKTELFTRSGNTENPDSEWSEWSRAYDPLSAEKIESPPARYIQWKARFSSIGSARPAILRSVMIPYLQYNESPEMKKLLILMPGQKIEAPSTPGSESTSGEKAAKKIERGKKGIIWEVSDPNGDALLFMLSYRSDKQTEWTTIDEVRGGSPYIWNHQNIPDGLYRIKIKADDSPSNFKGDEKSSEIQSEPFLVDTTAPEMRVTKKSSEGGKLDLSLIARDATGIIQKLAYSTDQKNWTMVRPDDRIGDSSEESFQFSVDVKDSGTVFLKCIDDSLNETTLEIK